jgi:hypothetical protein
MAVPQLVEARSGVLLQTSNDPKRKFLDVSFGPLDYGERLYDRVNMVRQQLDGGNGNL